MVKLTDKLTFGKYRNRSLITVLNIDLSYVKWMVKKGVIEVSDYVQRTYLS